MIRSLALILCVASPMAKADVPYGRDGMPAQSLYPEEKGNVISWYGNSSWVAILEYDTTGCPYYLEFHNENVHLGNNSGLRLMIEEGGAEVISVEFSLYVRGTGPDTLTIMKVTPDTFIPIPEEITVEEGEAGEVLICHPMF